jgi:hypothetical protein
MTGGSSVAMAESLFGICQPVAKPQYAMAGVLAATESISIPVSQYSVSSMIPAMCSISMAIIDSIIIDKYKYYSMSINAMTILNILFKCYSDPVYLFRH